MVLPILFVGFNNIFLCINQMLFIILEHIPTEIVHVTYVQLCGRNRVHVLGKEKPIMYSVASKRFLD